MAKFNNFSTFFSLFFMVIIQITVPSRHAWAYRHLSQPTSPPSKDEIYAQSLPQGFKDFIEDCAKKMTPYCSEEIVTNMVNITHVSNWCCYKLVKMGLGCHNGLVKLFSGLPEAKGYESLIVANGAKVYNKCALVAKSPSLAPYYPPN